MRWRDCRRIPRNRATSGCRGVLLQGDCGNVENPSGNGYVEIESRKKAATARVSGSSPLVWYQPAHEAGWCGGNGMNTLSFDSKRCERIRRTLIPILAMNYWWKLPVRWSFIWRVVKPARAIWSRGCASVMYYDALWPTDRCLNPWRANILRTLRDSQRRSLSRVAVKRWTLGLAVAAVVLFGVFAAEWVESAPRRAANREHSEAWSERSPDLHH